MQRTAQTVSTPIALPLLLPAASHIAYVMYLATGIAGNLQESAMLSWR
jgi:hypothetical protein